MAFSLPLPQPFCFSLGQPRESNTARKPDLSAVSTPGSLAGLVLLLVDDEPSAVQVLGMILRHHGAEVYTALSAQEAFEKFLAVGPDVLVSDIGMPVASGYDLIGWIRNKEKQLGIRTPAVALTAFTSKEDREKALAHGFDLHLGKPMDPICLMESIVKISRRT